MREGTSRHMCPCPTLCDVYDSAFTHAEAARDGRERLIARTSRANLDNGGLGEFRHTVTLASHWIYLAIQAALTRAIFHVVAVSTEKQMLLITAARRIAVMADKHPVRNWAVRQLPRDAMGVVLIATGADPSVAFRGA